MPEKRDNSYQNISFARQESSIHFTICCGGHLNGVALFKKKKQNNSLTKYFALQGPDPP